MNVLPTHKQIAGFVSEVLIEKIPDFKISTSNITEDTHQSGFDGEWPSGESLEKCLEAVRPFAEKLAEEVKKNSGRKFYRFPRYQTSVESYEVGKIPVRIWSDMDIRTETKLFRVDVLYGG